MSFRRTVLFKLLLVLVVAGALAQVVVVTSWRRLAFPHGERGHLVGRNLGRYANMLIESLGDPPREERARELQRELGIEFRVEGPLASWSTSSGLPTEADLRARPLRRAPDLRGGWHGGRLFLVLERNGHRYYLFTPSNSHLEPPWEALLLLVVSLFAIGILTALAVGWVLAPMRELKVGVRRLGQGDLSARLPEGRNDELGELADSFNAMADRIRAMIESRERLLRDVSHELRTPLTRMKVGLEFLPDDKSRRQLGDEIVEMEKLVDEILEFQRLDSPNGGLRAGRADLCALVRDVAARYAAHPPGILPRLPAEPVTLQGDAERLTMLIRNLVDNALKYSRQASRPVEVSVEDGKGVCRVIVRDYGIGIAPEEISKIFEPFYRVDRARSRDTGGVGIGLSLSRRIAEAHGGRIDVTSTPGEGTTMKVILPRRPDPS